MNPGLRVIDRPAQQPTAEDWARTIRMVDEIRAQVRRCAMNQTNPQVLWDLLTENDDPGKALFDALLHNFKPREDVITNLMVALLRGVDSSQGKIEAQKILSRVVALVGADTPLQDRLVVHATSPWVWSQHPTEEPLPDEEFAGRAYRRAIGHTGFHDGEIVGIYREGIPGRRDRVLGRWFVYVENNSIKEHFATFEEAAAHADSLLRDTTHWMTPGDMLTWDSTREEDLDPDDEEGSNPDDL